jgi:hypothetical protein
VADALKRAGMNLVEKPSEMLKGRKKQSKQGRPLRRDQF